MNQNEEDETEERKKKLFRICTNHFDPQNKIYKENYVRFCTHWYPNISFSLFFSFAFFLFLCYLFIYSFSLFFDNFLPSKCAITNREEEEQENSSSCTFLWMNISRSQTATTAMATKRTNEKKQKKTQNELTFMYGFIYSRSNTMIAN